MADAIDFSTTRRVVLVIDLNPLLQNPNPNYINSILRITKSLIKFPNSSLFSFKLFFSSLSPIISSSLLPTHALSFGTPSETLNCLEKLLSSLSLDASRVGNVSPNAGFVTSALLQLVLDYDWSLEIEGSASGIVRSNLVVLCTPVCRSMKCLAEFLRVDVSDLCLGSSGSLGGSCAKFCERFRGVSDAFDRRDIHLSWVDVDAEGKIGGDECVDGLGFVENAVRSFGWGFCSADSIVLGSALVPFGLIYPKVGMSFKYLNSLEFEKKIRARLSLEVSDVSEKPLEFKCCDLDLLHLKVLPKLKPNAVDAPFWDGLDDGNVTLHVKAVQRYVEGKKIEEWSSDQFLVCGSGKESAEFEKKCFENFYADRVLKLLSSEKCEHFQVNSLPIWSIILNFLYDEGCWASLSISNGNGDSCMGILKPYTIHLGILSIIDNECNLVDGMISKGNIRKKDSKGFTDSQTRLSQSINNVLTDNRKRRTKKESIPEDLIWSSFCKAAFEGTEFDLTDVYFTRDLQRSKKAKFLKCWMKQMKKSNHHRDTLPNKSSLYEHTQKDDGSSPLCSPDQSGVQEDSAFFSCSGTLESFFCDLPSKIQQGLEAEGVDLQILAQRLVSSTIYWLHKKQETDNSLASQTDAIKNSCRRIVAELTQLLLHEPKSLKDKYKDMDASIRASIRSDTLEIQVKEYELQIFLRMEILRAEVADGIEEVTRRKLVKQICTLLEIIQFLVDGGFHGSVSLYQYVERTLKTRYGNCLADVLDRLYDQMDLLPFGDEDETRILLNSEDSSLSWRGKHERDEMPETTKRVFAEHGSSQSIDVDESPQGTKKQEHARKLSEARERREKARRYVSFTSRIPDLQRVWAPKQSKVMKTKSGSLHTESKRKKKRTASYHTVGETPLTGRSAGNNGGGSCPSVSKALFQD